MATSTISGCCIFITGRNIALDGVADEIVLLRRRAHDRGEIDRFFSMRHAGDMEDRELPFERIKARVVAKGPFGPQFAKFDVSFENDFGVGGHLEIDRLASHQLDWIAAQKAGKKKLVHIGGHGQDAGKAGGRVRSNRHGDFQFAAPDFDRALR